MGDNENITKMYCIYLNLMLRHVTLKSLLKDPISYHVQNDPDLPTWFLHCFFIFKQLYKTILFTAVREGKNRDIVFWEIINTMETRPISPTGAFCSGVYYTREWG